MEKGRLFSVLIAVSATIAGIVLTGYATPLIVGCCFLVAAAAYFITAYLSLKKKK